LQGNENARFVLKPRIDRRGNAARAGRYVWNGDFLERSPIKQFLERKDNVV
jgi:hypothetical protein